MDRAPPPSNGPWATSSHSGFSGSSYPVHRAHLAQEPTANEYVLNQPPAYNDLYIEQPRPSLEVNRKNAAHPHAQSPHIEESIPRSAPISDASTSDEFLHQALEFTQQPISQQVNHQRLRLPVAIPQMVPGLGKPFARCYSQELQAHGVSVDGLVKFIDHLNVVSAGSPPLQIVDLAGGIVGMVPFAHAQLISFGIQTAGKIGTAAVSKTRGSIFLKKANTDFFNPRGLKVELVTTEALRYKLRIPPNDSSAILSSASNEMGVVERRVAMLKGYAAPVTFDVPAPDKQTNILNKWSVAQQKMVIAKQEKKFAKARAKEWAHTGSSENNATGSGHPVSKKRQELQSAIQEQAVERQRKIDGINAQLDRKAAKKPQDASKIERERRKEVEKVEKDARKEMHDLEEKIEKESGKSKKDSKKGKDKEMKAMNKIQWILIEEFRGNAD